MKYIQVIVILVFLNCTFLNAQQEQHFSQFMFNRLAYNVGYAGTDANGKLKLFHRSQWVSFDGAPQAQTLSYNQSFLDEKVGAGIHLRHQSIGVTTQWTMDFAYAYRLKIRKNKLGLGVGFSMRYFGKNFGDDSVNATESRFFDNSIPEGFEDRTVGNMNLGLYFENESFYFGISVPRLLDRDIRITEGQSESAIEVRHYYLMGGANIKIVDDLVFQPNVLMKYIESFPLDLYVNASLRIQDKVTAGLTYHSGWRLANKNGNSIGAVLGFDLNKNWTLSGSYDYELSDIRKYTMGSVEFGLTYHVIKSNAKEDIIKLDLY